MELWKSDGTEAGTVMVKDIWPGGDGRPLYLTDIGGILYFRTDDGTHGCELWRSDGTEAGTVMVKDLHRGQEGSYPRRITNLGGTAFFTARALDRPRAMERSDGLVGRPNEVSIMRSDHLTGLIIAAFVLLGSSVVAAAASESPVAATNGS